MYTIVNYMYYGIISIDTIHSYTVSSADTACITYIIYYIMKYSVRETRYYNYYNYITIYCYYTIVYNSSIY